MKTDKVIYTPISELIKELEEIKKNHGDIPVCYNGSSPVYTDVREYYYDGGYYLKDATNIQNYISSRSRTADDKYTCITEGFPQSCVDIRGGMPGDWEDHSLNGRPVREIDPDSWEFLDKQEYEERKVFGGYIVKYAWEKQPNAKGYYPVKAYLDSGEFAFGENMKEAREALTKIYTESKQP